MQPATQLTADKMLPETLRPRVVALALRKMLGEGTMEARRASLTRLLLVVALETQAMDRQIVRDISLLALSVPVSLSLLGLGNLSL